MKSVLIDLICVLVLTLLAIIYVTACLLITKIKLRYSGQWFYLLIGVEVGLVAFFVTEGLIALLQANIFESNKTEKQIHITILVLEALFESCINTVHWVFAVKYWSVARRL